MDILKMFKTVIIIRSANLNKLPWVASISRTVIYETNLFLLASTNYNENYSIAP